MKLPLKFDSNGTFKIIQFTDLHQGPSISKSQNFMNKILECENPNMVILTGDNIDGKCKTLSDVKKAITYISEPMETNSIPWAIVFGNHDDEHGMMTKEEMMNFYMTFKYNISKIGFKTSDRIGNYNLTIESSKDKTPAFNLYMLDSGKYALPLIGGYDWIKCTQVWWYKLTSLMLKLRYKKNITSLMFFHIPLPEFNEAWKMGLIDGEKLEEESCPKKNTCSLFNAIVKTGDVKGVFVGHDHLNNYCAVLKGVRLGYAGHSGYGGYGSDHIPHSARVFLINESDPANFKTWLSLFSVI